MVDLELVEDLSRQVLEEVVDGARVMIEGGYRRNDSPAGQRYRLEVADVDEVERWLAGHEYERPSLLQ